MSMPQGWELILIVLVIVLLFGARKLPDAARGLGRSLRIFKSEVKEGAGETDVVDAPAQTPPQAVQPPAITPPPAQPPVVPQQPVVQQPVVQQPVVQQPVDPPSAGQGPGSQPYELPSDR